MERPAGFWIRFGALLLDGLIMGVLYGLISLALGQDFFEDDLVFTDFLNLLYMILLPVFWRGYVIGKRLVNIRMVKKDGSDVKIGNMLMRVIVAGLVYALTFGIGIIVSVFMVGLREDKRALHDFIAGTYVKHE